MTSQLDQAIALAQDVTRDRATQGLLNFTCFTKPDFLVNWHHRLIAQTINAMFAGATPRQLLRTFGHSDEEIEYMLAHPHPVTKLIAGCTRAECVDQPIDAVQVHLPPRHGKTELISRRMPAYYLGNNPTARVIATSYGADLASMANRDVQRIMDDDAYRRIYPDVRLNDSNVRSVATGSWLRNSDIFEIVGHGGSYKSSGVGGGVTGLGATCFVGSSKIETENGSIAIEDFYGCENPPKVWGYNHKTGRRQLCRVKAVSRARDSAFVAVQFADGRKITCTRAHLFYTRENGYRQAKDCNSASHFVCATTQRQRRAEKDLFLSAVPYAGVRNSQSLSQLLPVHAPRHRSVKVFQLQQDLRARMVRVQKGQTQAKERRDALFLHQRVRLGKTQRGTGPAASVHAVCDTPEGQIASAFFRDAILLPAVQGASAAFAQKTDAHTEMFDVPQAFCVSHGGQILQHAVQKHSACTAYEGQIQPSICGRPGHNSSAIQPHLSDAGAVYSAAGQASLLLLQRKSGGIRRACASHKREEKRQSYEQSHSMLRELPFEQASLAYAQAEKIESFSGSTQFVYDIEVEECHNYFCEKTLVHNCAIVDDPFKSRKQVESPVERQTVASWYSSVLYTRLEKLAKQVITNTRWHESDLSGYTISKGRRDASATQWFCIVLPAILDCEPGPGDFRAQGEALWPQKYSRKRLDTIKATIGAYEFDALYQQRPSPGQGGVVKSSWWQYYDHVPQDLDGHVISADLTFGNRGDYAVFQVWGFKNAMRYLIEERRERMGFTEQLAAAKALNQRYPTARAFLVENSANGAALINVLTDRIPAMVPIRPAGSKSLRLDAVAPQIQAGNVVIPSPTLAPWVDEWVEEFKNFPNGAHDDRVDAASQALEYLRVESMSFEPILFPDLEKEAEWNIGLEEPNDD